MLTFAELTTIFNLIIMALLLFGVLLLIDKCRPSKLYVTYVTQRKGGHPVYHHAILDRKVDPLEWITSKDSKDKNIFYRIAYVQPVTSKVHINMKKPADDNTGVRSMNNGRFESRYAQDNQQQNDNRDQGYNREGYNRNNHYQQKRKFAYQG